MAWVVLNSANMLGPPPRSFQPRSPAASALHLPRPLPLPLLLFCRPNPPPPLLAPLRRAGIPRDELIRPPLSALAARRLCPVLSTPSSRCSCRPARHRHARARTRSLAIRTSSPAPRARAHTAFAADIWWGREPMTNPDICYSSPARRPLLATPGLTTNYITKIAEALSPPPAPPRPATPRPSHPHPHARCCQ